MSCNMSNERLSIFLAVNVFYFMEMIKVAKW